MDLGSQPEGEYSDRFVECVRMHQSVERRIERTVLRASWAVSVNVPKVIFSNLTPDSER